MPSTIEAIKGANDANCYAEVATADTYFDDVYGASDWADIDEDDKVRLLITATKMIDALQTAYSSDDSTQTLNFPLDAECVSDIGDDGFDKAVEATILQAMHIYRTNDTVTEGILMGIQGSKSESIGPTSKTVTGYNPLRKFDRDAMKLLAPYLDLSMKSYRG